MASGFTHTAKAQKSGLKIGKKSAKWMEMTGWEPLLPRGVNAVPACMSLSPVFFGASVPVV